MLLAFLLVAVAIFLIYLYVLFALWKRKKFGFLIASAAAPLLAYQALQFYWYARFVPAQLEIAYPVAAGSESGFREGCGVAVYKLSAKTLAAIEKKGIEALDSATQARGHLDVADRDHHLYTYQPWKQTPVPLNWTSEGTWLMCRVVGSELEREIIAAAKQGGAYYTTKHEAQLLVIPSLGYVVFSHYG